LMMMTMMMTMMMMTMIMMTMMIKEKEGQRQGGQYHHHSGALVGFLKVGVGPAAPGGILPAKEGCPPDVLQFQQGHTAMPIATPKFQLC
jgi:hypothetical protein